MLDTSVHTEPLERTTAHPPCRSSCCCSLRRTKSKVNNDQQECFYFPNVIKPIIYINSHLSWLSTFNCPMHLFFLHDGFKSLRTLVFRRHQADSAYCRKCNRVGETSLALYFSSLFCSLKESLLCTSAPSSPKPRSHPP